ncbi:NAD(P)-dependent oxidoreductase [bacterium]|nr:NAD(P)-dependent oxidoreductase [bacterium]
MNILLTGHKGFIGNRLLQYLQSKDHTIIAIDKLTGHDIISCDFPHNIETVIHLAGLSGVRDSLNNPADYWKTNVIGSQRIFDFYKTKRVIYASSSTAYEPWRNPYAMSKYSMEQLEHPNSLGMRFTTVYGPGARETMLIPKILKNDIEYLNINHTRDFIHVDDVISAIYTVLHNDVRGVIDVGTSISNKLIDIADYFKIDYENRIADETERLNNTADTKILNSLGWHAKTNLYGYIEENKNVQ